MHRHAVCFGVESGNQGSYLNVGLLPEKMKGPGTVFSAAPGYGDLRQVPLAPVRIIPSGTFRWLQRQ